MTDSDQPDQTTMHDAGTDEPIAPVVSLDAPLPLGDRVSFALRQAGMVGFALLLGGLITTRLRPDEVLDRGIAGTPFFWAIVVWCAVLGVHALAYERSQLASLEKEPLIIGCVIALFMTVVGFVSLEGSGAAKFAYVLANAVGSLMFWWGVASLGLLLTRRVRFGRG